MSSSFILTAVRHVAVVPQYRGVGGEAPGAGGLQGACGGGSVNKGNFTILPYLDAIPGQPKTHEVQLTAIRGTVSILKRALGSNFMTVYKKLM